MPIGDRYQTALTLMAQGDFDGALQGIFDPNRLPPSKRLTTKEFVFGKEPEGDKTVIDMTLDAIKGTITNPVALAGFLLSSRLGFKRSDVEKIVKQAADYEQRTKGLSGFLLSPAQALRTRSGNQTKLGADLQELQVRIESNRLRHLKPLSYAEAAARRLNGGQLSASSWYRINAHLEQPWNPKSPAYKEWQELSKEAGHPIGIMQFKLTAPEKIIFDAIDKIRRDEVTYINARIKTPAFETYRKELESRGLTPLIDPEFYSPRQVFGRSDTLLDTVKSALGGPDKNVADNLMSAMHGIPLTDAERARLATAGIMPKSYHVREQVLVPRVDQLEKMSNVLLPGTLSRYTDIVRQRYLEKGQNPDGRFANFGEYNLDSGRSWAQYIDATSRHHAWTEGGLNQSVITELEKLGKRDAALAHFVQNTTLPMLRGTVNADDYIKTLQFEQTKYGMVRYLKDAQETHFKGPQGKKAVDFLTNTLLGDKGWRRGDIDSAITQYVMVSTLGGNPAVAVGNLLQTIQTTTGVLGPTNAMAGIVASIGRLKKYWSVRKATGNAQAAHDAAFGDMESAGVMSSTGLTGTREFLEQAADRASISGAESAWQFTKRVLMAPFGWAENFNRVVAYDGARRAANRVGFTGKDASAYAKHVVETTQFPSSPLTTPMGIQKIRTGIPGGRLATQFASFSTGMLQYYANAALNDRATLLRSLSGTAAAYETARAFGVDFGRYLGTDSLPLPREGGTFGALPWSPPALSLAFGGIKSAMTGDSEGLRRNLPMLVPGGVALSRAMTGFGARDAARFTGKPYVDYKQQQADGRYAMYHPTGQLIGYFSPGQIWAVSMGFKPTEVVDEQAMSVYFKKYGQNLSDVKSQAQLALLHNDPGKLGQARAAWKEMTGQSLLLSKHDLRMVHEKRMYTRLSRQVQSLPEPVQNQFRQILPMAISQGSIAGGGY